MNIKLNDTQLSIISCNESDTLTNKYLIVLINNGDINTLMNIIKEENIIIFDIDEKVITYSKLKFDQITEFRTGEIKLIFERTE